MPLLTLSPVTRLRLRRFRHMKRAWWSLWLLVGMYALSLLAELLCNGNPYYVRCAGRSYFPFLAAYNEVWSWPRLSLGRHRQGQGPARFGLRLSWQPPTMGIYPQDRFLHDGVLSPPDYKLLAANPAFTSTPGNYMIFPPLPYGKNEIVDIASLPISHDVTVVFEVDSRVGTVDLTADHTMLNPASFAFFCGLPDDGPLEGQPVATYWTLTPELQEAMALRFRNQEAPRFTARLHGTGGRSADVRLPEWTPRSRPPTKLRVWFEEPPRADAALGQLVCRADGAISHNTVPFWNTLPAADRQLVLDKVKIRLERQLDPQVLTLGGATYRLRFERENRGYPFRPVGRHLMGLDDAGRDVFARILYALRISLNFGVLLSVSTFIVGILLGALQGYFGGLTDLLGQRLIEIWGSLPFLYVMILLGSIYGRSFLLLLAVYAAFNWIGISLFLRAEFLKQRRQQYVEAAKCLGIPNWKIMLHHILPNSLVPVITLFPFSLIGAIYSLSMLDYLGFGLPPPTPSWGELLHQAQEHTRSWWLITYPTLSIFIIILLGVLIGEGVRHAFDPRSRIHLE